MRQKPFCSDQVNNPAGCFVFSSFHINIGQTTKTKMTTGMNVGMNICRVFYCSHEINFLTLQKCVLKKDSVCCKLFTFSCDDFHQKAKAINNCLWTRKI